ncbi:hypothetical protein [Polaromonas sp. CG9_12]|nr:hypothetical protein [Polaromonas sp. CG9_12]
MDDSDGLSTDHEKTLIFAVACSMIIFSFHGFFNFGSECQFGLYRLAFMLLCFYAFMLLCFYAFMLLK